MFATNQCVVTPLGIGCVEGFFGLEDSEGAQVITGIAVRLEINDLTRPHLHEPNCMTPNALLNGVWIFMKEELKHE